MSQARVWCWWAGLLLLVGIASGCGVRLNTDFGEPPLEIDSLYIVPDDYEGFLVIRYNCPGGQPIPRTPDLLTMRYSAEGAYCTNEPPPDIWGNVQAQTRGGRDIPIRTIASADRQTGYTYFQHGIWNLSLSDGERGIFQISWVGEGEELRRLRDSSGTYDQDLFQFLETRFDIEVADALKNR